MARYAINPITGKLDRVSEGGGSGGGTVTNVNVVNSGSSILVTDQSTTPVITLTDSNNNTLLGASAGNNSISGSNNNALGNRALNALTTGMGNNAIGNTALNALTTGIFNTALGHGSGSNLTTGSINLLLGSTVTTGACGQNYTTENNNILLNNSGTIGDENVLRIGTQGSGVGETNKTFIAGVASVATSNSQMVTVDTTTGQIGSQEIPSTNSFITVTGTITNAQLKTLRATPVTAIPAQGSGKVIRLISVTAKMNNSASVALTGNGIISLIYSGGNVSQCLVMPNAQINALNPQMSVPAINAYAENFSLAFDNKDVQFKNLTAAEIGGVTTVPTMSWSITYQVISI